MESFQAVSEKKRLLTGIRASGEIHLGNLLGAMKPAIEQQENYDSYLFIADLHALTTSPDPKELQQNVRSVAAAWLAAGLNLERSIVWKQSDVREHTELAYFLSCVTSMGLLERAHSYKDAQAQSKVIKAGLFFYPVLMASDILLYSADLVPVGKDQAQHLEMARDMATFFNETYGETFKLPREIIQDRIAIIPGTDGRKMSKSYDNGINIFGSEKQLKKQVMRIVTDSKSLEEPKNPEEVIVYQIFKLVAPESECKDMEKALREGGYGYGDAKKKLLSVLLEQFGPMRQKYSYWMEHEEELDKLLESGATNARAIASQMMEEVRSKVGL